MLTTVVASLLLSAAGMEDDQVSADFLQSSRPHSFRGDSTSAGGGVLGRKSNGSVLGVDSVVNWSSYFYYPGVDSNGFTQFTWPYTMVGNAPFGQGGEDCEGNTTTIKSPVVPVNLDLRNYDGSPRYVNGQRLFYAVAPYVNPTIQSPVYQNAAYDSSQRPTQFTDAVQRAEFYKSSSDDWHTILKQSVKPTQTMVLVRGTYAFALNADGTCCRFVLVDADTFINALFPVTPTDTTTIIGAAENSGAITTRDISSFLFPNTFLFVGSTSNCCIIGFHTYDLEPGDKTNGWRERRYVVNYSSWVSPGIFQDPTFLDIAALSHELAETFNDPFTNNYTPWWTSSFNCQNNLETGDVIEGLPNAQYPITLNGYTYHPQNEALLQWFAGQTPSSAIHHAYSYPDTTILTKASVSQNFGCYPPIP